MIRKDINELCLWVFKWLNVIFDAKRLRCIHDDLMTYLQKVACCERIKWQSHEDESDFVICVLDILTTWYSCRLSSTEGHTVHSHKWILYLIFESIILLYWYWLQNEKMHVTCEVSLQYLFHLSYKLRAAHLFNANVWNYNFQQKWREFIRSSMRSTLNKLCAVYLYCFASLPIVERVSKYSTHDT